MTSVTSSTIVEMSPNAGVKKLVLITPATLNPGDTIAVTLANYGITNVLAVRSCYHTTDYSVIVSPSTAAYGGSDAFTTAVSSGILTISMTAGTGLSSYRRVFIITGGN